MKGFYSKYNNIKLQKQLTVAFTNNWKYRIPKQPWQYQPQGDRNLGWG